MPDEVSASNQPGSGGSNDSDPSDMKNKLKLARRNCKGQLTRTLNTMEALMHGYDPDIVKEYLKRAEYQFTKVEEKHGEFMEMVDDDDYDTEEKWMVDCEIVYIHSMQQAKKFIMPPPPKEQSPAVSPSPSPDQRSSPQPAASNISSPVQAPRMTRMRFPTFNGDLKEYIRFKQLFNHCTTGMSELDVFYQLTECMERKVEQNKIKGCINLARAWQVLDESYGDQDKLVDSLLTEVNNLKSYDRKGKAHLPSMSDFVQTLQNFETMAETLGISNELNSRILLGQIKQRLPEDHRIAYLKSVRDEHTDDSLSGLVSWLHSELTLLEKAKPISPDPPPMNSSDCRKSMNAATVHSYEGKQSSKGRQCPLHPQAETHYLKTCNKFRGMQLDEKYNIMKEHKICFRCGHDNCNAGKHPYDASTCQFASPCRVATCGADNHFTAICPVVYGDQRSKNSGQLNSNAEPYRPTSGVTGVHVTSCAISHESHDDDKLGLQGVLPTVMGYLSCGSQRWLVRILLDDGSQATLIRKGILPKKEHDNYQDHNLTLVGGSTMTRRLRMVDCHIEDLGRNWSFPVTLTEIDEPCGKIPIVQPDQLQQYRHLSDVDIEPAPSETIDVLLGVDNTYLMVWKDYIMGERVNDPIAVRSPFGWYIQGGRTSGLSSLSNYVNVMQNSVTQRPDGAHEVQLPWMKPPDLPDNYTYPMKRLKSFKSAFDSLTDIAYVPSQQNATDLVSRGGTASAMEDVIEGPQYLKKPPTEWPQPPATTVGIDDEEQKTLRVRNANTFALTVNMSPESTPTPAPSLIVNDNGSFFRGANNTTNDLNSKFDQNELRTGGQRYNAEWEFGPPGGPHFQDAVERMVQEIEEGMCHLVKADELPFVEWETVSSQLSSLINS